MCDMLIPHGGLELLAYSCEALMYLCIGFSLEGIWDTSLAMSARVHWPTLWEALREQGVPEHLVWLLENGYDEQLGEVMGE